MQGLFPPLQILLRARSKLYFVYPEDTVLFIQILYGAPLISKAHHQAHSSKAHRNQYNSFYWCQHTLHHKPEQDASWRTRIKKRAKSWKYPLLQGSCWNQVVHFTQNWKDQFWVGYQTEVHLEMQPSPLTQGHEVTTAYRLSMSVC